VLDAPGWLERLLKHFENPTVGAVGPVSNYVMGLQHTAHNLPYITEQDTLMLVGFFMAIRKEVVDEVGPLEENFDSYVPELPEDQRAKLARWCRRS
jgi:cellulose synthase/poly-beta-1,6-N-acetylglucosamine synthase-like glycosyltransferase